MRSNIKVGIDISFWSPNKAGGIQSVLVSEILSLDNLLVENSDIEIFLLCSPSSVSFWNGRLENIKVIRIFRPGNNIFTRFFREHISISLQAKKLKLDIVHSFNYFSSLFVPCKSVITLHDMNYKAVPQSFGTAQKILRSIFTRISIAKSAAIVTVSHFSKQEILKYTGYKKDIFVIYNAPNSDLLSCKNKSSLPHVEYKDYILAVGSTHPHKNLNRLLEAFTLRNNYLLNEGKPLLSLVLTGLPKRAHGDLLQKIEISAFRKQIHVLGYVSNEELASLYKGAIALIFPSLYEGFGIPPLEAMCFDCPVVCSDAASIPEVVEQAAILIDPYDSDSIAKGIRNVCENSRRSQLIELGRQQVLKFSWMRSGQQIISMYRYLSGSSN